MSQPNFTGAQVLRNPYCNQGTAFTKEAREKLRLTGLLPPRVMTIELQAKREMERIRALENPVVKYGMLESLYSRNRTLYFYLLVHHIEELMPLVYEPIVGKSRPGLGQVLRNPDGLYVSIEDKGNVQQLVDNCSQEKVDVLVVTDGERILGLGDLGTESMEIAKGKLALYVACAGIHPDRTLPVVIDIGTNNPTLLKDPLYLGLQMHRVEGDPYYELIEELMTAVKKRWPKVLVQFEAFANRHAFELLKIYRNRINCFNDDIQGTATVALASLLNACKIKGSQLKDEKILFLGAGESAVGSADLMVQMMIKQGLSEEEAKKKVFLFDSKGIVSPSGELAKPYAENQSLNEEVSASTFLDAVEAIKPTTIIGLAAQAGAINAYVLGTMARINERPIIFALSTPTSKAECSAREAYTYTNGRAIFACGSTFAPIAVDGKTYLSSQGKNSYAFPGIGLGTVFSGAKELNDGVFLTAAEALSQTVTAEELSKGSLLPNLTDIRRVSFQIAKKVAQYCFETNLSQNPRPDNLDKALKDFMYKPLY